MYFNGKFQIYSVNLRFTMKVHIVFIYVNLGFIKEYNLRLDDKLWIYHMINLKLTSKTKKYLSHISKVNIIQ